MEFSGKEVQSLVNGLGELVYLSDMDTYDLLYVNDACRTSFNISQITPGMKCYEALQNLDAPCPFCTNKFLNEDSYYTWSHTNEKTKRHFILKDRIVRWNGKPVRMEIAFDLTRNEEEKVQLKTALESQSVLLDCVRGLYRHSEIETALNGALESTGLYLGASRAYILEFTPPTLSNTYEWCRDGTEPEKDILQGVDMSLVESWMPKLSRRECYVLSDVEKLCGVDSRCYDKLKEQNIKSLAVAPLESNGELFGCIGVDDPQNDKIKNNLSLLQMLGYFIMLAYQRDDDKKKLLQMGYEDQLTKLGNRNSYTEDLSKRARDNNIGAISVDLNGLKERNDTYGHLAGDAMLVHCADILREVFPTEQKYRLGGDEFVIFCTPIGEKDFVNKVNMLRDRFENDDQCSAAVGCDWTAAGNDLIRLISNADDAMYADKKDFYHRHNITRRYRHSADEDLSK